MSATLNVYNSKFVIFGSGHDYTLADSGDGSKVFFSHPYVPLNSVNYAGQYYFTVLKYDDNDETAEPVVIDAVKDDIAHCTFTPALNTAFTTEGEVEITVKYRREYVYAESTVLVEKEMTQTVEVVNHGTVSNSFGNADYYSDGYLFIRPQNVNTVQVMAYDSLTNGVNYTKVSSIPWRATSLGRGIYNFLNSTALTDISELGYADTSKCTAFSNLFSGCSSLVDISPISHWDTSKVQVMSYLFSFTAVSDLTPLRSWNTSSVVSLDDAFVNITALESLDGIEGWDVSNCTSMLELFFQDTALKDISALADWDVSSVNNLHRAFSGCTELLSLEGLEDWDVSNVQNLSYTFNNCYKIPSLLPLANWKPKPTTMLSAFNACKALVSLEGVEQFDTSACTTMQTMCNGCLKLLNLDGVESWDVSACTDFRNAFAWCYWISDISAIANWTFGQANCEGMFLYVSALLNVDDIILDLSQCTSVSMMFATHNFGSLEGTGVDVYEESWFYVDYEGNSYSTIAYSATLYSKDASNAENWTVSGTNLNVFGSDNKWNNVPSWN